MLDPPAIINGVIIIIFGAAILSVVKVVWTWLWSRPGEFWSNLGKGWAGPTSVLALIVGLIALVYRPSTTDRMMLIHCHQTFHTIQQNNGKIPQKITFKPSRDCDPGKFYPKEWRRTASLIGTTIAGGFSEYQIDTDPEQPSISFFGPHQAADGSEASVDFIAFRLGE